MLLKTFSNASAFIKRDLNVNYYKLYYLKNN